MEPEIAIDPQRLAAFLVTAKSRTYAGSDDDATSQTPMLPGSKQLEFRDGDLHYCDIYFGMKRFSGIELVRNRGIAIWSMSYSGGIVDPSGRQDLASIYGFLRAALQLVDISEPFRGPRRFEHENLIYDMAVDGGVGSFSGFERISRNSVQVYGLNFAGGCVV